MFLMFILIIIILFFYQYPNLLIIMIILLGVPIFLLFVIISNVGNWNKKDRSKFIHNIEDMFLGASGGLISIILYEAKNNLQPSLI
jgi:ABC-type transport system involved in cytochrome bd biosynthesis fused ATPase/permease subunit